MNIYDYGKNLFSKDIFSIIVSFCTYEKNTIFVCQFQHKQSTNFHFFCVINKFVWTRCGIEYHFQKIKSLFKYNIELNGQHQQFLKQDVYKPICLEQYHFIVTDTTIPNDDEYYCCLYPIETFISAAKMFFTGFIVPGQNFQSTFDNLKLNNIKTLQF